MKRFRDDMEEHGEASEAPYTSYHAGLGLGGAHDDVDYEVTEDSEVNNDPETEAEEEAEGDEEEPAAASADTASASADIHGGGGRPTVRSGKRPVAEPHEQREEVGNYGVYVGN